MVVVCKGKWNFRGHGGRYIPFNVNTFSFNVNVIVIPYNKRISNLQICLIHFFLHSHCIYDIQTMMFRFYFSRNIIRNGISYISVKMLNSHLGTKHMWPYI